MNSFWKGEAFMSLHSLHEQSVWRCNYFSEVNPRSNSISIVHTDVESFALRSACSSSLQLRKEL